MKITLIIMFISLLTSCKPKMDKLFLVDKNPESKNYFLIPAESPDISIIKPDSLNFFLTEEEFLSAELFTFKNFGTIYNNKTFNVVVLLKARSYEKKDYTFILRTFDNKFKIIDSYEFANWIESEDKYCFGSINKHLIIEKICNSSDSVDIMQITKKGNIIMTSFHKS